MAEEQDKTHRLLFHFPRMIKDLIRLCLGGEWIERLDFESLKRVPERLLSKELVRREQDVLWRLKYLPQGKSEKAAGETTRRPRIYFAEEDIVYLDSEDEFFYIYLHLEHQSHPRPRMALDMITYKLLTAQDLTRNDFRAGDKLPMILQVVFYNGEVAWNVPTSLLEMIRNVRGAPEGLDFWSYKLIDAQRMDLEELVGADSPLLGLFRLEQLRDLGDLEQVTTDLQTTLRPEDEELGEAFATFSNEAVLPKLTPEGERQPRIQDLLETSTMVSQRVERIPQGLRLEDEQIGIRKGELAMLRRMLERKFG